MTEERINERALPRFAAEVKVYLAFLEAFGFRCVRSEAALVRFESSRLAVTVYHAQQSYDIGLEIASVQTGMPIRFPKSSVLLIADEPSNIEIMRLTPSKV